MGFARWSQTGRLFINLCAHGFGINTSITYLAPFCSLATNG